MLETSSFFKLFPPPRFLTMPHAGLDISDDGIHCIRYDGSARARRLGFAASAEFPEGLVDGGDVKDDAEFARRLAEFSHTHGIARVKVSVPEEKAYLFQTEVTGTDAHSITQNIEFKLEENVPLSAADALFYYELFPLDGGALRASVSVVPRSYIERYTGILATAGMFPTAFEISPKAIARAVVPADSVEAKIIINIMRSTTGIYVVSGGVLCFTSTVAGGAQGGAPTAEAAATLAREIMRVYAYWMSHDPNRPIGEIILAGRMAASFEDACSRLGGEAALTVRLGDVWCNAFDLERYLPPVSRPDSLEYAAAAGLAFDLSSGS